MVSLSFVSLSALVLIPLLSSVAYAASCTGNPPMYNGLPCATTTRYWDGQKGACGCGTGDQNPFSWQWNSHTAAASQLLFDQGGSGWCGAGCGACYEITPTGDCTYGTTCATFAAPITIMVTNRCPYIGNEEWCPNPGSLNPHGFPAHFDLMDYQMSGWVDALGWNNPVVTYRQVPCGNGGSPTCSSASQCQCATAQQCQSGSNITASSGSASSSTATSTSSSTSSSTVTTVTSTSAAAVSTSSTSSVQAPSSGSGNSNSNGNSNNGASGCSATIAQSVGSTWVGGGLMNVVITNSGSLPIREVVVNLSGNAIVSSWNLNQAANNQYSLPSWSFPIQVGATYTSSGYTFGTAQPTTISLNSVTC